jgi:hypothetical protein
VDQYGRVSVEGPVGVIWRPPGNGGTLVMQGDGNLVNYDPAGRPQWATGTGVPGSVVVMQTDGNLVVYAPGGRALWASKSQWPAGGEPDPADRLLPKGAFFPNLSLTSPNGAYRAVMQSDGNFVVYGPAGAIWATGTSGPNPRLSMQADGNLVLYSSTVFPSGADQALWHTRTVDWSGTLLIMQDDGNLVLYRIDGTALWSSKTSPGTKIANHVLTAGSRISGGLALISPNYLYRAIMQRDGNLVVYGPNGPNWASGTGQQWATLVMATNGDAAIAGSRFENGRWHSNTAGNPGAVLVMQDDGNLVVYRPNGTPAWASLSPWTWKPPQPYILAPTNGWW